MHSESDRLVLFLFLGHVVELNFQKSVFLLSFFFVLKLVHGLKCNDVDRGPLTESFLLFYVESLLEDLKLDFRLVGAFLIIGTVDISSDWNGKVNCLLFVTTGCLAELAFH